MHLPIKHNDNIISSIQVDATTALRWDLMGQKEMILKLGISLGNVTFISGNEALL